MSIALWGTVGASGGNWGLLFITGMSLERQSFQGLTVYFQSDLLFRMVSDIHVFLNGYVNMLAMWSV